MRRNQHGQHSAHSQRFQTTPSWDIDAGWVRIDGRKFSRIPRDTVRLLALLGEHCSCANATKPNSYVSCSILLLALQDWRPPSLGRDALLRAAASYDDASPLQREKLTNNKNLIQRRFSQLKLQHPDLARCIQMQPGRNGGYRFDGSLASGLTR
jgi:hypothetical protein